MKNSVKRGFTLVEVMIVVAIIGLLAAVGIPAILSSMSTSEANAQQRNIADVEKAKGMLMLPVSAGGMAVTNGAEYGVAPFIEGNLMKYMTGADSLTDLKVGDFFMNPNGMGTTATYETTEP